MLLDNKNRGTALQNKFLKRNQTQKEIIDVQIRENPQKGIYATKDKRLAKKLDFQSVNFSMGNNPNGMPQKSYQQDLIGKANLDQVKVGSPAKGEINKLIKEARDGHFNIAMNNNRELGTSNQLAYDNAFGGSLNDRDLDFGRQELGIQSGSHELDKQQRYKVPQVDNYKEMYTKKVNFNLGTDPTQRYTTTNNENYNDATITSKDLVTPADRMNQQRKEQKERVDKGKRQQFSYGNEQPKYESIMKNQFQEKSLTGTADNRLQREKIGKELRKAHFDMGKYQPAYQESEKYMKLKGPTQQIAKFIPVNPAKNQNYLKEQVFEGGKNANQQSNFTTAHTQGEVINQFVSLNKQAAECANTKRDVEAVMKEKEQMKLLKKDVRSAHFQFGTSEPNYLSQSVRTLVEHPIQRDVGKQSKVAKENMQKTNFYLNAIPDQSPVKTTNNHYQSALENPQATLDGRPKPLPKQGKSNVVITNDDKLQTTTEHNYQFNDPYPIRSTPYSNAAPGQGTENKAVESYLKAHHFRIGSSTTLSYDTTSMAHLGKKLQSKTYRVPQEFKNEQRATHFKMGYEVKNGDALLSNRTQSAAIGSDNKRQGLYDQWKSGGGTAAQSTTAQLQSGYENAAKMAANARVSNVCLGAAEKPQGNIRSFRQSTGETSNKAAYRWIQPCKS